MKYHRITFMIKVALGPADIRFELWHNGQKLSKDNPIKVEWHAAQAPPVPPVNNNFYHSSQQWKPDDASAVIHERAWSPPPQPGVGLVVTNWNGNPGY
jgi:hypothetical protein